MVNRTKSVGVCNLSFPPKLEASKTGCTFDFYVRFLRNADIKTPFRMSR